MPDLFRDAPLDLTSISQNQLDIAEKKRSNPLPWHGQFSPQLAELLIREFSTAGATVFDPFVGSGTVLHEAARTGRPAVGVELNPAAVKLARVYELMGLSPSNRSECLAEVERAVFALCGHGPLFGADAGSDAELQQKLLERLRDCTDPWAARLWTALIVLSDFESGRFSAEFVLQRWRVLADVIRMLPVSPVPVEVLHADARATGLDEDSIDLVVTSPPYINVFNYHQRFRKSVEALEWDVLKIARSEIGANRKHRGNRFLTVVQYCLDMAQVVAELQRICAPGARIILVVGRESNVRGVPFYNGALLAEVAGQFLGQGLALRQERKFLNRFGTTIVEDILHFDVPIEPAISSLDMSVIREVPADALREALANAGPDVVTDIEEALARIEDVAPSPILPSTAFTTG